MVNPQGKAPHRHVLVHGHMFKNAGTTFDWSLARSFGDTFVDHRDDAGMKTSAAYLGPWLQAHTGCRALSSHWITPPLPELPGASLHLCLLFRDPIERMRSVYQFEREQQGVDTPGSRKAKQLDFHDYVHWQFQPMPGPVIKNYQTRYCSSQYHAEDLDGSFARAWALLESLPVLGLVHRYDESMVLMEYHLGPWFPNLDLSYQKRNVLSCDGATMAQRREAVLEELGPLAPQALERNRFDIELLDRVEGRFDALLASVPDLPARLSDLRARNRAHQATKAAT